MRNTKHRAFGRTIAARVLTAVIATFLSAAYAPTVYAAADFRNLGAESGGASIFQAKGISPDGSYIVGQYNSVGFIWTATEGLRILNHNSNGYGAVGVSDDGNTIVGSDNNYNSARWTATEGPIDIGSIPGYGFGGEATAVSADGSVIIGYEFWRSTDFTEFRYKAYRWTEADGIQPFDQLLNETSHQAHDISADGRFIVGTADNKAYRWSEEDGAIYLGNLPGGVIYSIAYGVSNDGKTAVGISIGENSYEAFRWTEAGGMIGLGDFPGSARFSQASDVSGDGRIVVGSSDAAGGSNAFIWDATHGMRPLQQELVDLGLGPELTGWTLTSATAISDDGKTIVGYGINPNGEQEAFLAVLPEPGSICALLIPGLATLARGSRVRRG